MVLISRESLTVYAPLNWWNFKNSRRPTFEWSYEIRLSELIVQPRPRSELKAIRPQK